LSSFKKIIVLDTEGSTKNKGNAFTKGNVCVLIQIKDVAEQKDYWFTKENFHESIDLINSADLVIGFNIKYDAHIIEREFGIKFKSVWDCQLAEFLFSNQTWKYPSLNESCIKRGLEGKIDIVKTEYWDKGIDTTEVPLDILVEYGMQDIQSTYQLFLKQLELFETTEATKWKLFRLHCNDLLVLQEIEWNGMLYDVESSLAEAVNIEKAVEHRTSQLNEFAEGVPINFDSRDHVSVFLYGGEIKEEFRIPVGVFKTGKKVGETRYKVMENIHKVDRKVEPLKGTENAKEGYWSTEESTLRSLKTGKNVRKLIDWILERAKLQKLNATYLRGLPTLMETMEWGEYLHPNYNQCVTVTGRLSSTKPNGQNMPGNVKKFAISRFD
jgi:DNA polymerase-1